MKRKITLAAYLAGATTLAVSLPAMADQRSEVLKGDGFTMTVDAKTVLPRKEDDAED